MVSGSVTMRMHIAWYDFRSRYHDNILPGMISGSSVINVYILEPLNMYLSYGCLGMCFYTCWQHFANMISPAQMTITARTASKFCARARFECPKICSLTWHLGEIL